MTGCADMFFPIPWAVYRLHHSILSTPDIALTAGGMKANVGLLCWGLGANCFEEFALQMDAKNSSSREFKACRTVGTI